MNGDLRELYQEVIFDHNRSPRNFHAIESPDFSAEGHNPLCGDQLRVYVRMKDGRIEDASFEGHGCAISRASASLMTEAVKGMSLDEADALFRDFHAMLTDPRPPSHDFGKLQVLAGVREFPVRVKCATLAWHTLHNAIARSSDTAKTE